VATSIKAAGTVQGKRVKLQQMCAERNRCEIVCAVNRKLVDNGRWQKRAVKSLSSGITVK
jgi:hypothetical protein